MHLIGGLAQLVERVLSMHEVWGSIPQFSRFNRHSDCDFCKETPIYSLTSWPSGLRRCVKAAVFLAWVRIPPKSLFDWESLPGRGGGIFSMGFIDHPISHPGP